MINLTKITHIMPKVVRRPALFRRCGRQPCQHPPTNPVSKPVAGQAGKVTVQGWLPSGVAVIAVGEPSVYGQVRVWVRVGLTHS